MLYALILIASVSRLLPHPPNFACIAAAGLFAGCYLRGWKAMAMPVAAMLLSDVIGHVFHITGMGFYNPMMMLCVYASMAASVLIGATLRRRVSVPRLLTASLAMSTVFFVATNAAVWASGMYSFDFVGLLKCYAAALPFFQFTVAGDLFFSALMFGGYELGQLRLRRPGKLIYAPIRK